VSPLYWVVLGASGWFSKRADVAARRALAVAVIMLLVSAVVFGSEDNTLWGHWRYLLPICPLLSLGSAMSIDALALRLGRVRISSTTGDDEEKTQIRPLARSPYGVIGGIGLVLAFAPLVMLKSTLYR